jgi:bile acid-coenzyme A ligase
MTWSARIAQLAARHPEKPAIVFVPREGEHRTVACAELDRASNRAARLLATRGAGSSSTVVVALPNCPEHYFATLGAWKVGALVLPLNPRLPAPERDALLDVAREPVVVHDWEEPPPRPSVTLGELRDLSGRDAAPLPDVVPRPGKAIASGGSTGRPKIIIDPRPWVYVPGEVTAGMTGTMGMRPGQVQMIAGALYHNTPFGWGLLGLFEDHTLIVMEKFDAARFVDLVERYRVSFSYTVPTMMHRIARLPDIRRRDLSSLEAVFSTAAPCAPWLKRFWIDLIGPEKVNEAFGAAEAVGACIIRGDEWLEHPGSVGRAWNCDLKILDDRCEEVPTGEVGEIYMRPHAPGPTYEYRGAAPVRTSPEGYMTVGDMGWVDEAGYLFLADRRVDMIISGGANIYPAEVEAALTEHPQVADVAVIGIPDEEWGKRVHAVVQPVDAAQAPSAAELDAHVRRRIASYKVPRSYELVPYLPRDDAGKIRRSALAAERGRPQPG